MLVYFGKNIAGTCRTILKPREVSARFSDRRELLCIHRIPAVSTIRCVFSLAYDIFCTLIGCIDESLYTICLVCINEIEDEASLSDNAVLPIPEEFPVLFVRRIDQVVGDLKCIVLVFLFSRDRV